MGKRIREVIGQRFGRLVVTAPAIISPNGKTRWRCRCDCGKEKVVSQQALRQGKTTSCGCYQRERCGDTHRTHGDSGTPMHRLWTTIKRRCLNPNTADWKNYGARGIRVCRRWATSYEAFRNDVLASIGPRPGRLTLDRVDNDGNYRPGNIRWATRREQEHNKRKK